MNPLESMWWIQSMPRQMWSHISHPKKRFSQELPLGVATPRNVHTDTHTHPHNFWWTFIASCLSSATPFLIVVWTKGCNKPSSRSCCCDLSGSVWKRQGILGCVEFLVMAHGKDRDGVLTDCSLRVFSLCFTLFECATCARLPGSTSCCWKVLALRCCQQGMS